MAHPINMPQVGQDIETAVITEWKVREGDRVEKGEVVALVESDKAVFEVEAFESGTLLKILFNEDEEACVLEPIAFIGDDGEVLEDIPKPGRESEAAGTEHAAEPDAPEIPAAGREVRISASPSARRLASEMGIDVEQVSGSGPQGRVVKEDILRASAEKRGGSRPEGSEQPIENVDASGDMTIPFSRMRQSIADRMTASARDVPHFYLSVKADVTEFLAWREQYLDRSGRKISISALVLKSAVAALKRFPRMNAHVAGDNMTLRREVNIGLAVSLDEGLVVPVISNVEATDLAELSAKVREISESARSGLISAASPGTFTVSNLGMVGITEFLPIINPPEAGILGVGAVEKQLSLLPDGKVCSRDILALTLGCDHRAVDGYYAGQFLQGIKEEIEKIELWQNL